MSSPEATDTGSVPDRPFFSIVTISLNGGNALLKTAESVLSQENASFEYIVKDGLSSDGSVKELQRRLDDEGRARLQSTPDTGIGDAMNQGLAQCRGEFVLFLHAGDRFLYPNVLQQVERQIRSYPEQDIHAYAIQFGRNLSNVRKPRGFTPWINLKTTMLHQAAFCRRTLFERHGNFDTRFAIAMDYEWFLRVYRAGAKAITLPEVICFMDDNGVSSQRDPVSLSARFEEERRIHHLHATGSLMRSLYELYWLAYSAYRRLRSALRLT